MSLEVPLAFDYSTDEMFFKETEKWNPLADLSRFYEGKTILQ